MRHYVVQDMISRLQKYTFTKDIMEIKKMRIEFPSS